MIRIVKTKSNFEREPFLAPVGFKGGYVSGAWQSIAVMQSEKGNAGLGLATQSPLWSDAAVFAENFESAGNSLMYLLTAHALNGKEPLKRTLGKSRIIGARKPSERETIHE